MGSSCFPGFKSTRTSALPVTPQSSPRNPAALSRLAGDHSISISRAVSQRFSPTGQQSGDTYLLREKDVRRSILEHLTDIDLRRVDQLWFLDHSRISLVRAVTYFWKSDATRIGAIEADRPALARRGHDLQVEVPLCSSSSA